MTAFASARSGSPGAIFPMTSMDHHVILRTTMLDAQHDDLLCLRHNENLRDGM